MDKRTRNILTIIMIGMLFFIFYYVFAKYGIGHHDFRAHAQFAGELCNLGSEGVKSFIKTTKNSHILSYPGWHICFLAVFLLLSLANSIVGNIASDLSLYALSVAFVNAVILVVTFAVVRKILEYRVPIINYWRRTGLAFALLFVGPLYIPGIFDGYYMGPRTGNIWHNPTYLIVKPFAVLIFFLYIDIFKNFKDNNRTKENKRLVLAGILLCVSAVLKPSFYQMFLPALFCFCLVELIKEHGKNLGFLVKIGLSVVPVTILAVFQIFVLSGSSEGGTGIGIEFLKVWGSRTPYWYIALLLSLVFPLFIFIADKKFFMCYEGKIALAALLSGMIQYMFLYVTKAPKAGDFGWGFALSIFLLFLVSVIRLEQWKKIPEINLWKIKCAYFILSLHTIFGIIWFYDIFKYLRYTLPLML